MSKDSKYEDDPQFTSKSDLVTDDVPVGSDKFSWSEYPKTVFFIVGNEFCERFSYYGMRTVLVLYIINILNFDDDSATAMYHGFIVLCYTTPLLGSILADGYIGKYHTILWVSLLYAAGNVILASASFFGSGINPHPWLDLLGLIVIGFGTGGIKPCVSAFGGDQFVRGQERMLETFFSVFYFSINAGSTISSFITPVFRTLPCLGSTSCYPLAFGMPAVLMLVATGLFVVGTPWYRRYPPKENVIGKTFKCMLKSISNKSKSHVKHDHWLDHFVDNESDPKELEVKTQFKEDVKVLLRVCVMYLPVPVFWALFDQQGSRWVIQGVAMDGQLGGWTLLPDQMPTLNAVLIMAFIPLFQFVIYPAVKKCGIEPTPLRRMSAGGFFAAASFIVAAFVQLKVNTTLRVAPASGLSDISFSNMMPCPVQLTSLTFNGAAPASPISLTVAPTNGLMTSDTNKPTQNIASGNYTWQASGSCFATTTVITVLASGKTYDTPLVPNPRFAITQQLTLWAKAFVNDIKKPQTGQGQSKVSVNDVYNIAKLSSPNDTLYFCNGNACDDSELNVGETFVPVLTRTKARDGIQTGKHVTHTFAELRPGYNFNLFYKNSSGSYIQIQNTLYNKATQGGIYAFTLYANVTGSVTQTKSHLHQIVTDNSVSIFLQVPQYVIITAAEIMFSITGLEFSYSQAPASMKSVIQAIWLLTVAGGDLIVLVIAEARLFSNLAVEFLVYAALMAFVIIIFSLLAIFYYEYANVSVVAHEDEDDDSESKA